MSKLLSSPSSDFANEILYNPFPGTALIALKYILIVTSILLKPALGIFIFFIGQSLEVTTWCLGEMAFGVIDYLRVLCF